MVSIVFLSCVVTDILSEIPNEKEISDEEEVQDSNKTADLTEIENLLTKYFSKGKVMKTQTGFQVFYRDQLPQEHTKYSRTIGDVFSK